MTFSLTLSHVGIHVTDMPRMVDFYTRFLGFAESDRGQLADGRGEIGPVTHGNALSLYFRDPEGNRLELLVDTPWYVPQPCRIPVDLSLPDEALWASVKAKVRGLPGFKPRAAWEAEIQKKIAAATASRRRA